MAGFLLCLHMVEKESALVSFSSSFSSFFLKNKFIHFIYFWLHWVFIAACSLSLVVVRELLIAVASLVAEHGL